MLLPHKATLRIIRIGYLASSGRGHLFNASDFPNLECLGLSRWQMAKDLELSAADATSLLAPKLATFEWSFSIYDQHSESLADFGSREEGWVHGLAREAIARGAALRKIKITFNPDEGYGTGEHGMSPWDRMDDINKEIAPRGVTLDYGRRPLTPEEWSQLRKQSGEQSEDSDGSDADSHRISETECLDGLELESVMDYGSKSAELVSEGRDIRQYFRLSRFS